MIHIPKLYGQMSKIMCEVSTFYLVVNFTLVSVL